MFPLAGGAYAFACNGLNAPRGRSCNPRETFTPSAVIIRYETHRHVRYRAGRGASFSQFQYRVHGLGFGPFTGANETPATVLAESVIEARMNLIRPYTQRVRTYGCLNGLGAAGTVARRLGLQIAMGAWINNNHSANLAEIDCVIARAAAGQVDIAIIGSEALHRGEVSDTQLAGYIQRFKDANTGVPVTAADTDIALLASPLTLAAVDQVFCHIYPFWEGYPLNSAIAVVHSRYSQLKAIVSASARPNRPVVLAESGWPRAGSAKGAANPSPENAAAYFLQFVSWARANNAPYYYFEAMPEPWKGNCSGCDVEPHFGIADSSGALFPGMISAFEGKRLPDTWTGGAAIGSGAPAIALTYVPPYGTAYNPNLPFHENLRSFLHGRVTGAAPAQCSVGVYVQVGGAWWVKPYADSRRATPVLPDGTWRARIDTGGNDPNATAVSAYLFCDGSVPPVSLPSNPSLPSVTAARTFASISGRVRNSAGAGTGGVTVQLGGLLSGSALTAPGGFYSFPQLSASANYTFAPALPGATFVPPSASINNLAPGGVANVDFTAAPDPDVPPGIITPSSGQTIGVAAVTFSWTPVAGAAGYDLSIHDTSSGAAVFSGSLSGRNSTSTVISVPNGSYRFLVRACRSSLQPVFCGAFRDVPFQVQQVTPGAAAPVITSPIQNQTITASTVTLGWTGVAGGSRYELLVTNQSTGAVELNMTEIAPSQSTIFSFPAGVYRARVRACSFGCGPWSGETAFTVQLPLVPSAAPVIATPVSISGSRVTVSWGPVANADLYRVQAVQSGVGPGGGALTVAARQVSGTQASLDVPAGSSSLLVQGCNGDGCGPLGAPVPVNLPGPNPAVPNLGTPMAGTASGNPVIFSWNRVPGDNGSNTLYRLYVQDLSRSAPALDLRTNQNFWAAWFRPGVRYDALVIAHPGGAAAQGPPNGFVVRGANPAEPVMVQPQINGSVTEGNVTLGWTPIDGATQYEYYVSAAGNPIPVARGLTPGLSVQVPLLASGAAPVAHSAQARACVAPPCDPANDAGWSKWAGATNFDVIP